MRPQSRAFGKSASQNGPGAAGFVLHWTVVSCPELQGLPPPPPAWARLVDSGLLGVCSGSMRGPGVCESLKDVSSRCMRTQRSGRPVPLHVDADTPGLCFVLGLWDGGGGGGGVQAKKILCPQNGPLNFGSSVEISVSSGGTGFWFWVVGSARFLVLGGWVCQIPPPPPLWITSQTSSPPCPGDH